MARGKFVRQGCVIAGVGFPMVRAPRQDAPDDSARMQFFFPLDESRSFSPFPRCCAFSVPFINVTLET